VSVAFENEQQPTAADAGEATVVAPFGEPMLECPLCNRPGAYVGKEFVAKVDGTEGVYRDCRACDGTGRVPDRSTGDQRRAQASLWGMSLR
jgi:hypothetical protein